MARDISAEMSAASLAEVVRPFYLIDMNFSSPIYLWSGLGELDSPVGDPINLNPSFDSNLNNWSTQALGTGSSVTYTTGQANLSGPSYNDRAGIYQSTSTVAGKKYTVTVEHTGADVEVRLGDMYVGPDNYFYYQRISAGTFQYTFTALGTTTQIMVRSRYGGTAAVKSIKLNNTQTYQGLGDLLKINQIKESTELQANGTSITLTGVKTSLVQVARDEDYQGKTAAISLGAMNELGDPIISPVSIFEGFMDVMTILDSGDKSTINVTLENKLIAFERKFVRRFTDNDQRIEHPSDKGFEFVASLQDKEIIFGRATPASSVASSGSARDTSMRDTR